jgi:SAM-dependent methyltransferase
VQAYSLESWSQAAAEQRGASARRMVSFYNRLFEGTDLPGKSILDIGGGIGLAATYALAKGASRATLLEPEGAGSRRVLARAHRLRAALGLDDRLTIRPDSLQEYRGEGGPFDVAILEASINHIDEEAVVSLPHREAARNRYHAIIEKIASLLNPGASVVVSDCARRNFFGDLGLRNPLAPSIQWHKHQQPATWIALFRNCGFGNPKVRWGMHTTLGAPSRILLGNAVVFYFLSSYFILTMHYAGSRNRASI